MKKLLMVIGILFVCGSLYAQEFTVKKITEVNYEGKDLPNKYMFIYPKTIEDIDGNKVIVKDEGRTITQTEAEIINNKIIYQNEVNECDKKLAEIEKLKGQ